MFHFGSNLVTLVWSGIAWPTKLGAHFIFLAAMFSPSWVLLAHGLHDSSRIHEARIYFMYIFSIKNPVTAMPSSLNRRDANLNNSMNLFTFFISVFLLLLIISSPCYIWSFQGLVSCMLLFSPVQSKVFFRVRSLFC